MLPPICCRYGRGSFRLRGKEPLPTAALPEVIAQVHQSLRALSGPKQEPQVPLVPAVPIKKSVTPDYIISLEDGREFKSMKRYLVPGRVPALAQTLPVGFLACGKP